MRDFNNDLAVSQTVELMTSYSLDLHGYTAEELITQWRAYYRANWIRLATIEALYLGRYKAISVEQILSVWSRLGNPNPHFSHEFERLICRKLPQHSTSVSENSAVTSFLEEKITTLGKKEPIGSESSPLRETNQTANAREPDSKDTTKTKQAAQTKNPTFKFSAASALRLHYPARWSRHNQEQPSIQEFTPLPDVSSFYNKLKSLAEEKLEEE